MSRLRITKKLNTELGYRVETRCGLLVGHYNPETKTIQGIFEMRGKVASGSTRKEALALFTDSYESL
ncbi:hypothetical protein [Paenibacillus sp. 1P03SA]|uniref:hypothetical protein n=1 Tax=Paenibacillus sp. 1P03SA TaxID=3132294 RepID=UPI0039A1C4EE